MNTYRLMVLDDFYRKDFKVGEIVPRFEGQYRILDLNYQNTYGTFILCEFIKDEDDFESESKWVKEVGVPASLENPYEIIGSIHIPEYRNLLAGTGYYVKNHRIGEVRGLSYRETWNFLFREGARNAVASKSTLGNYSTRLIDTLDELPSLDSSYWKITAFNEIGEAFAPLTESAHFELEKAIRHVVQKRVRGMSNKQELSDKTVTAVKEIEQIIAKSEKIVVLTGAGISTNSGIPDYRSSVESLWRKSPYVLADLNQRTFETDPNTFWNAFDQLINESLSHLTPFPNHESLIATIKAISSNEGHQFFAWLEKQLQKDVTVVTQNVDGLHQKVGSNKVLEIHGNIFECTCPQCQTTYPLLNALQQDGIPKCECGGILRPNVVFFGDAVRKFDNAMDAVEEADLIFVVGTSLEVYPFNQLINLKNEHAKLVLINGTPLDEEIQFDIEAIGDISRVCKRLKSSLDNKKDEINGEGELTMENEDELIPLAYKIALEEQKANPERFTLANETLNKYEQFMLNWKQGDNLKFIEENVLGEKPETVAASGLAKMAQSNFLIFIKDDKIQEKLIELILIKQQTTLDKYEKINKIMDVNLTSALERFQFRSGPKPKLLVNRLLIMMFPEIFTTIANPGSLNKTARCIGIKGVNSFEKKQIQIKDRTDSYLEKIGEKGKVSKFFESVIGWWILEAESMLLKSERNNTEEY